MINTKYKLLIYYLTTLLYIIFSAPASAATFERYSPCGGNAKFFWPRILIKGDIQNDTAEKLEKILTTKDRDRYEPSVAAIVFDSRGGSLSGAIKLGKIIRNRKISTELKNKYTEEVTDSTKPDGYYERILSDNASCLSACAIAFMGGTSRYIEDGAKIGIHQFYTTNKSLDETAVQNKISELIEYMREMGIASAPVINIASKTSPREIYLLSMAEITSFNIDNTLRYEDLSEWEIKFKNKNPYVYLWQNLSSSHSVIMDIMKRDTSSKTLRISSIFAMKYLDEYLLDEFTDHRWPKFNIKTDVGNIELTANNPWLNVRDQDIAIYISEFRLTNSDIEILKNANDLYLQEDTPHSLWSTSIFTNISTKNLRESIDLLN